MGIARIAGMIAVLLAAFIAMLLPSVVKASTAEAYDPAWTSELGWANQNLWHTPEGSQIHLEDERVPWWQSQVAHPQGDYDAVKLPVGAVRLDSALDVELTLHRPLQSWTVQDSPSHINDVWTFTPGGKNQGSETARSGQNAFFDL